MNIRSVTLFSNATAHAPDFAPFLQQARAAFPVPVQSVRLATSPFPDWWPAGAAQTRNQAEEIAGRWTAVGVDYHSLGPVLLRHEPAWLQRIPDLLQATDRIFTAVEVADVNGTIDPQRATQAGRLISTVSRLQQNGFANLYLAVLANCPPGTPFFPVAYHAGGAPHFALAVESADLALAAIRTSSSLAAARQNLVQAIETAANSLAAAAANLAAAHQIPCSGIDFSLAPFPGDDKSLAAAMEAVGISEVGGSGALFAAGLITEALERADFPRCGFSGLMLPVLEDSILARRAAAGQLQLPDLLSYAAVCGVGLDTIPLPGDVTPGQLTAVLLDVAMLAARLDKPLTARLMPMPGLRAGDPVTFDFPFFANSSVMALHGTGVAPRLQSAARLQINSRRPKRG